MQPDWGGAFVLGVGHARHESVDGLAVYAQHCVRVRTDSKATTNWDPEDREISIVAPAGMILVFCYFHSMKAPVPYPIEWGGSKNSSGMTQKDRKL